MSHLSDLDLHSHGPLGNSNQPLLMSDFCAVGKTKAFWTWPIKPDYLVCVSHRTFIAFLLCFCVHLKTTCLWLAWLLVPLLYWLPFGLPLSLTHANVHPNFVALQSTNHPRGAESERNVRVVGMVNSNFTRRKIFGHQFLVQFPYCSKAVGELLISPNIDQLFSCSEASSHIQSSLTPSQLPAGHHRS